jgi:pyrroline-5-carboxylate reductase
VIYDYTENISQSLLDAFTQGMRYAGLLDHLPEELIDAGTSVAGCGPAFAFYFMESLIKGGVACGLPEEKAALYAKYMLLGSARLALESNQSPAQLRNAVCSPAGSTIEGVHVLENQGFSDAAAQAVFASYKRNVELGK